MKRKVTFSILLIFLLSIVLSSCDKLAFNKYNINYTAVDIYQTEVLYDLEHICESQGLSFHHSEPYSYEEIQKIAPFLNEDDMIVYYTCLYETEFNHILHAFGYANINDFLRKKKYLDENGAPSIATFRLTSYVRMTEYIESQK